MKSEQYTYTTHRSDGREEELSRVAVDRQDPLGQRTELSGCRGLRAVHGWSAGVSVLIESPQDKCYITAASSQYVEILLMHGEAEGQQWISACCVQPVHLPEVEASELLHPPILLAPVTPWILRGV